MDTTKQTAVVFCLSHMCLQNMCIGQNAICYVLIRYITDLLTQQQGNGKPHNVLMAYQHLIRDGISLVAIIIMGNCFWRKKASWAISQQSSPHSVGFCAVDQLQTLASYSPPVHPQIQHTSASAVTQLSSQAHSYFAGMRTSPTATLPSPPLTHSQHSSHTFALLLVQFEAIATIQGVHNSLAG